MARVIAEFGGRSDVAPLAVQLEIGMKDVSKNDLRACEATLFSQVHVLDTIFAEALLQAKQHDWFSTSEALMRIGLKAQSQYRATVETLAVIKNPPVVTSPNYSAGRDRPPSNC